MSSILSSKEMFINMNKPPVYNPRKHYFEQSSDVIKFFEEEKSKITNGVYIGGFFVHPWLYYHLNYFKTPIPLKNKEEKIMCPPLDDNFMYVVESYQQAEKEGKGLCLFGTRGFAKSTSLASLTSWLNTIRTNGVTSIVGGSDGDLQAISALLERHFNNVHPALQLPRLVTDWDSFVEFGLKEKTGHRYVHSQIAIRNVNRGSKKESEKSAGLSPVGYIMDEIGKFDCKGPLNAALPSFRTQYGQKLVHLLSGTGGNKELSQDAKDILSDPEAYDLLMMNWDRLDRSVPEEAITWTRSKKSNFAMFVPGQMSYRLSVEKENKKLSEFL